MADQFGVTPEELRRVSRNLHDVSSAMKAVMSSLRAQLAAEGPVWGTGEMGHQFADGPNGYLAQLGWVNGSVDAKTGLLDYYSDLLKHAADTFQQADESGYSAAVPGTVADQSAALSGHGVAGTAPAAGIRRSGVPTEVGLPANAAASPPSATGSSTTGGDSGTGGSSGIGAPAGGSAGGPRASGAAGQSDPAGEGSGSGGPAPTAPVTAGLSDESVPTGVDSGNDESVLLDTNTAEGPPAPSVTSPNTAGFTGETESTVSGPAGPPIPPAFPNPPASPNPRRVGAPDDSGPGSPSPTRDGRSELSEPSATSRAGSRRDGTGLADGTGTHRAPQHSADSPERLDSAARRAGPVHADNMEPEGAARARRAEPGSSRRRAVTGDEPVGADDADLIAGHPNGGDDDPRRQHPGGERGSSQGLSSLEPSGVHVPPGDTDTASNGDLDEIITERGEVPAERT